MPENEKYHGCAKTMGCSFALVVGISAILGVKRITDRNTTPFFIIPCGSVSTRTEICIAQDSTHNFDVTNSPYAAENDPRWSPDESRFLFTTENPDTTLNSIYIRGIGGKPELVNKEGFAQVPHWIREGKLKGKIIFSGTMPTDNGLQIYIIDPDGKNLQKLTSLEAGNPIIDQVSPDGSKAVFTVLSNPPHKDTLGILDLNTFTTESLELKSSGHQNDPSFSPDSKKIVFTNMDVRGGELTLEIYNLEDKSVKEIGIPGAYPSWSPDGKLISYSVNNMGGGIFTMNPDGTNIYKVTGNSHTESKPMWGPNGKIYFYAYDSTGMVGIYKIDPNGQNREFVLPIANAFQGFGLYDLDWYPTK